MNEEAMLEEQLIDPEFLKRSLARKREAALEYLGKKWILHPDCDVKYHRGPFVLEQLQSSKGAAIECR